MMTSRRTILIVVAALVLGSVAALAVGVGRDSAATGLGTYGSSVQADGVLADDGTTAEADATAAVAVDDPAKKQPTLDKFEVKDPFIPLAQPNTGTAGTGTGTPTSAKIKINSTPYTVAVGDKVPSGSPVFTISSISSGSVTFQLPEGQQFDDGTSSVTVNVGESVKVTNSDTNKSYTLEVTSVGYGEGGGGTGGHTVSLVSINEQGGVAMATIEVDGKTYADKKEGDTFSTGWGDIKILSIDVSAQSVTIMHGDQTLTLHVGAVLTK
jgi:hypothetical protein